MKPEQQNQTMKRNYIIAKFWNEETTRLCVYCLGSEVLFGTEKNAQIVLQNVKESTEDAEYQIYWINTETKP